jgi:hypothetical protein
VMRGKGGSAADGVSVECSVGVLAIYWGSRRERERGVVVLTLKHDIAVCRHRDLRTGEN